METFNYTYSAKEQEEIKAIRQKYTPAEEKEDKMTRLRRLDSAVIKKAQAASIALGTIGALIMGIGMSLVMTDIGAALGALQKISFPLGIAIGVLGMVTLCFAYPVYEKIIKTQRKKLAPEIIRLADELMKQ